jgi:hypothetical protein
MAIENTLGEKNAEFIGVKVGGTYITQCDLKG